jgi:hypothetical protein
MIEWWNLFLSDITVFGNTVYILFVVSMLGLVFYMMAKN